MPDDNFPELPDLPAFTIEEEPPSRPTPRHARYEGTGLVRHAVELDERRIDSDAAKVVRRLEQNGFEAYLVGGCVRDLLLGGSPKDYDVATNARPETVRSLFRNCRIIGRRFRLAHVFFAGGKIIEVATFRRNPTAEVVDDDGADADLLIRNDNVFGDAHEDALRRDFTINALFYDLDRRQVLDWCGGMRDIAERTVRTIGDPSVRFREDPIRILRAFRFAARHDLGIDPAVYDAAVTYRDELDRAAKPRLFEEVLRLMRGGGAQRSMWLLWESGAMAVMLPELFAFLDDEEANPLGVRRFWRRLMAVDSSTRDRGAPLSDEVLVTSLLLDLIEEAADGAPDRGEAVADALEPFVERIALTRRILDSVRRIVLMMPRLLKPRTTRLPSSETMVHALSVLELDGIARGQDIEPLTRARLSLLAKPRTAASRPPGRRTPRAGAPRPAR